MTLCTKCSKPLRECTTIHAVGGFLYCSRECAVEYIAEDIIMNAYAKAIEIYDDQGEIVPAMSIIRDEIVNNQSEEA